MKNSKVYKNFLIKKGTNKDQSQLIKLLNGFPPKGILSECPQRFRQNFLKYLFENPFGVIIFAYEKDSRREAGYVIVIRHAVHFWSGFILSHPFSIGLIFFIKKYKSMVKELLSFLEGPKAHKPPQEFPQKYLLKFSWSSSSSQIARINFIGVLPEFRGCGVGSALYLFLAELLRKEGCKKIEAHIDEDNEASVRLHQKTGWQVQKLRDGDYKAVLNLE